MPKLKGSENKQLFGYQVDKENESVFFNDEKHVYLDKLTGEPYISVTTLLHSYEPPFNEFFYSHYKALEELADPDHFSLVKSGLIATQIWKPELVEKLKVNQEEFDAKVQEILDRWHSTRDESCLWGTQVHELMENSFYGQTHFDLSNYGCPNINGNYKCVAGYYPKKLEPGIYPEYLVSWVSPEGLRISGQIDCLICDNDLTINVLDWKTNKEIKKRGYYNSIKKKNASLLYPVSNLESCNWNIYQLQVSMYAYMLKQLNPEATIGDLNIVHIDRNGKQTIHSCKYLEAEVERIIHHYSKSLKTKELLDKNKPVII